VSDIDIAVADSRKLLDLKRPIREADIDVAASNVCNGPTADSCTAAMRRYSITSSARANIDCGTVPPSVFAVLRLITSSGPLSLSPA